MSAAWWRMADFDDPNDLMGMGEGSMRRELERAKARQVARRRGFMHVVKESDDDAARGDRVDPVHPTDPAGRGSGGPSRD